MKNILLSALLLASFSSFAQTGFWNDFSDPNVEAWKPTAAGTFTPSVKNNQLKLVTSVGGYNNLEYTFPSTDISANPKLRIKIISPSAFTLRIDLKDVNGK